MVAICSLVLIENKYQVEGALLFPIIGFIAGGLIVVMCKRAN